MNSNRKGIIHECQPEISDWILCADFEDELPQNEPERHQWNNRVLLDFQTETGVFLLDLTVDEGEPDYDEVAFRLTEHGFDIYNSDTYFEVYNKAVFCDDEECGEVR